MKFINLMGASALLLGLGACGDERATSSGGTVSSAISAIEAGVTKVGAGMGASTMLASKINQFSLTPFGGGFSPQFTTTPWDDALCDVHGRPQNPEGGDMAPSDERYPLVHTYCAMTVNDGDTVRGGFALAKELICALEKGGIAFAGATQTITPDFTDTECWPDGGPGDEEENAGIVMSAVGTSPAAFNNYFEKGVVFTVEGLGLTFSIAANLSGANKEFIAHELWGADAGDSAGDTGVMSGSLNTTTGALKFEQRSERIRSTCNASRCGFNRHTRLMADLELNASGDPEGVDSLEYGYADTQINAAALADPAATTSSARVVTASGEVDSELKGRMFSASGTTAQIESVEQWSETANTACGSNLVGIVDAACATNSTGIAGFTTDTKFALRGGHQSAADWLAGFGGFNFTTLDLDDDLAYAE